MDISMFQIVVTAVVIASAAGVALLCDLLKNKNEQLREQMLEMRLRHEREARRAAMMQPAVAPAFAAAAPQPVMASGPAPIPSPVAEDPQLAATAPGRARATARSFRSDDPTEGLVRKSTPAPKPATPKDDDAMQAARAAAAATLQARRKSAAPPAAPPAEPKQPAPEVRVPVRVAAAEAAAGPSTSKDSLSEWLNRRAAARAVQKTGPAAPKQPTAVPVPVTIDSSVWESLLAATGSAPKPAAEIPIPQPIAEVRFGVIQGATSSPDLVLPAGIYDRSYLSRLREISKPFTGLVISIGITDNEGRAPSPDLMRATLGYIEGLLDENEFGCRMADDEFLMVCPGVTGEQAQARLTHIAERLWDFQLRGVGAFSILFSWGGMDVQAEPLTGAIDAATDRMQQTRRGRKTVSLKSASTRRKAV